MHQVEDSATAGIYRKLTEVFHDVFDDDTITLNPGLTAADVDGWDSLTHIRLVLTAERTFGVKFRAAEVAKFKNVGELVESIRSKL